VVVPAALVDRELESGRLVAAPLEHLAIDFGIDAVLGHRSLDPDLIVGTFAPSFFLFSKTTFLVFAVSVLDLLDFDALRVRVDGESEKRGILPMAIFAANRIAFSALDHTGVLSGLLVARKDSVITFVDPCIRILNLIFVGFASIEIVTDGITRAIRVLVSHDGRNFPILELLVGTDLDIERGRLHGLWFFVGPDATGTARLRALALVLIFVEREIFVRVLGRAIDAAGKKGCVKISFRNRVRGAAVPITRTGPTAFSVNGQKHSVPRTFATLINLPVRILVTLTLPGKVLDKVFAN